MSRVLALTAISDVGPAVEDRIEIFAVTGPLPRAPEYRPGKIFAGRVAVLVIHEMNRGRQNVVAGGVLMAVREQAVGEFQEQLLRGRIAVELDEHLARRQHEVRIRLRATPRVVSRHLFAVEVGRAEMPMAGGVDAGEARHAALR